MPLINKTKTPEKKSMPEQALSEKPIEEFSSEVFPKKELKPEKTVEKPEEKIEQAKPIIASAVAPEESVEEIEDRIEIENILSQGLDELYKELPENRQKEFKQKGEETAGKISILLNSTKVKVKKIIGLIKEWLKMIPGVNKLYLEKEAKIKADKLMQLKNEKEEIGKLEI